MPHTGYRIPGPLGRDLRGVQLLPLPSHQYPYNWLLQGRRYVPNLPRPQAFPNIPREALIRTLKERLVDPSQIKQESSSLCGPTCLMYLIATHRPSMYQQFVMNLYEYGEANLGALRIVPGEDCKNYNPGTAIAAADWVSLASIRDSENSVFDYDDIGDEFPGITMPNHLEGWFEKVGFTEVRNETNVLFTKGASNWNEAVGLFQSGCQVCLFIKAHGIDNIEAGILQRIFPGHWVVLTSVQSNDANDIRFTVFTWGERFHEVPYRNAPLTLDDWLGYYYGYVSCRV